jgi:phosphatidylserine/phosphatidylglycerophosphate/cardiolipin synthase-like enzyme
VKTEKLFSTEKHDVFFNRGVASSQAYARKFGNTRPDKLKTAKKQAEAWEWLSRSLDEALYRFIDDAKSGDTLLGCFYEFHYVPVLERLKAAKDRGVDVQLIIDAKVNEYTDKEKKFHESFPREANLRAIRKAKLPRKDTITLREARTNVIAHNKFMVLLEGATKKATAAWTGSTNISEGGIFGHTNVGHWTRDAGVAAKFKAYWDLLSGDPGADGNSAAARKENKDFKAAVEALQGLATIAAIPQGTTPIFSPRTNLDALDLYANLVDKAANEVCVTLAFGIGANFKTLLKDHNPNDALTFLLLEKKDAPRKNSKTPFVAINASNNVYKAWGAYIEDPVYQWTRETSTRSLGLNTHVAYIHSKFLLQDPLGADPIIVTGSANFSEASTTDNDENMLIIRGDARMADIYFTEFNRLFHHYYFRSVWEELHAKEPKQEQDDSLFLDETPKWLQKYQPGKIRTKRVKMFVDMQGLTPEPA